MDTSYNQVYNSLRDRIHTYVSRQVSDQQFVDDLVQDIFLTVHAHIHELDEKEKPDAWIFRIARNRVIDYYRSRKMLLSPDSEIPAASASDKKEILQEFTDDIYEMIQRLPPQYREVIELTELKGMTQADAAQQLGLSLAAVKSRVLRGRQKLRDILLECCHFEFSRHGEVLDFTPRKYCKRCVSYGLHEE